MFYNFWYYSFLLSGLVFPCCFFCARKSIKRSWCFWSSVNKLNEKSFKAHEYWNNLTHLMCWYSSGLYISHLRPSNGSLGGRHIVISRRLSMIYFTPKIWGHRDIKREHYYFNFPNIPLDIKLGHISKSGTETIKQNDTKREVWESVSNHTYTRDDFMHPSVPKEKGAFSLSLNMLNSKQLIKVYLNGDCYPLHTKTSVTEQMRKRNSKQILHFFQCSCFL